MPKSSMKVVSSNIDEVSYDASSQTMTIEFNSGARYLYRDVPEGVYQRLISAASKGSYFADYIKGTFTGIRIR
jgi:hypothetical protein